MAHSFVVLILSILRSSALAEQCATHSPDEGSMNVQLPPVRQMIDSDNDRLRASPSWRRGVTFTSCPETLAPAGGRSFFTHFNASAQSRCIANSLAFIKVPKAGSSTLAGVFRRIAARNGIYGVDTYETCAAMFSKEHVHPFQEPAVCANHIERCQLLERHESKSSYPMLNFAVVRNPLQRALSKLVFIQTPEYKKRFPVSNNDTFEFVRAVTEQYMWLVDKDPFEEVDKLRQELGPTLVDQWGWSLNGSRQFLLRNATEVLDDFEVVGQTKRMAETALLVAFSLKLKSLADVLYVCAKCTEGNGGTSHSVNDVSKDVRDFIQGSMYKHIVKRDNELFTAAGHKMDEQVRTINEELILIEHNETFSQILSRFNFHLRQVQSQCGQTEHFAKSECYWNDNGCGWRCLDEYSTANAMQLALPVF